MSIVSTPGWWLLLARVAASPAHCVSIGSGAAWAAGTQGVAPIAATADTDTRRAEEKCEQRTLYSEMFIKVNEV